MAHVNLLHEIDLIRRGTLAVVIGCVWAAFAALVVVATIYDIGKWVAIW
jgi:hypothetical protein